MKFLKESKFFYVLTILILIGLVIGIYNWISFIFYPFEAFFISLFAPIIIAVFIFYIFLPVYKLTKIKIKTDLIAILITFFVIALVLFFIFSTLLPSLFQQITQLVTLIPSVINEIISWIEAFTIEYNISSADVYQYLYDLDISVTNIVTNIIESLTSGVTSILTLTIRSAIIIFTVPLLLFFLYKDGDKLPDQIVRIVPSQYEDLALDLAEAFHLNASNYIGGRVIVCLYVGVAAYIIFLILGVPNALLLGLITGIFDIIPYFGPFIGAAPAFLIAATISPTTALLLTVLITVVQLFESYLVTPLVMGKSLEMHPATVVILVLFANELIGLIGMILILPVYAILKACALVVFNYINENKKQQSI
ncbi:AI-2E family transporter [Alkalibacterium iburiense]|uniref:AI-2E family transporter n=1 Tax=Alkalibacterium iburiense TaxID=290589 RepID=A0ABN0XNB2_9LACT